MHKGPTIAVIIGSFHRAYGEIMLSQAHETATHEGLQLDEPIWVPGSMEKPLALKKELKRAAIVGAVTLGIIERGETGHGLVMAQAVIKSIIDLQLETMKPVGIGILGPEITPEQIQPRLEPYARDAVLAVSSMLRETKNIPI